MLYQLSDHPDNAGITQRSINGIVFKRNTDFVELEDIEALAPFKHLIEEVQEFEVELADEPEDTEPENTNTEPENTESNNEPELIDKPVREVPIRNLRKAELAELLRKEGIDPTGLTVADMRELLIGK